VSTQTPASIRRFGCFEADLRAGELRKQGVRIRLEDQPFQILALLLERPGELVTREELTERLWPAQTFVDFDRRLNVAMAKLRAALGDSGDSPRYIETLYRRGYRFLVPVAEHSPDAAEASAEPPSTSNDSPPATAPARQWLRLSWVAVIALAFLGALALEYTRRPGAAVVGRSAAAAMPRRAVAVLRLSNLSGQAGQAWLSTALSEWLTTELQAGEHLRTIPAPRVARMEIELGLADADTTARDTLRRIRNSLGSDLVVVGSYARLGEASGGPIRLDLRLLDTQSGETVAVLSETGVEADVTALVSRAGAGLRSRLGLPPITGQEEAVAKAPQPANPAAARLYSEGLEKLGLFDALAARDLLRKAVAAEPGYAPALAALATAWADLGYDRSARESAQKALDLSAGLSRTERLLIKGRYHEAHHDWRSAEDVYHALFRFFPDNLEYGLALADAQILGNRWHELLSTVATLRQLPSPMRNDPRIDLAEGLAARSLGDTKRSEAAVGNAIARARTLGASLTLAKALLEQAWGFRTRGRMAEADALAQDAEQIYRAAGHRAGAARAVTIRATVLSAQGDYRGARRIYEEALRDYREIGHKRGVAVECINIGSVLAEMGDIKGARRHFEQALATYTETGDPGGLTLAKADLGKALLELGEHRDAKRLLEESLASARQLGDRGRSADVLLSLSELLWVQGTADSASQSAKEARAIYREIGSASDTARAELILAEILLDQGRAAEAGAGARRAAADFEGEGNVPGHRRAQALAARAALHQGRIVEARRALEKAVALGGSPGEQTAFDVAITSARLVHADPARAAGRSEAAKRLHAVIVDAERADLVKYAFEARLALAEIEMKSGDAHARRRLNALEADARRKGLQTFAQRAGATLQRAPAGLR
jgi:eukaryotic-like serine/threonine-protein kinase